MRKDIYISDLESENQENVLHKSKRLLTYIIISLIFQSCVSSYEIVIEQEPIENQTKTEIFQKGIEK